MGRDGDQSDPDAKNPDADVQCTGQFITPNVVLTAGHCLKDLPDDPTGAGYDLTKQYFVLQYQNGEGSHTYKTKCALASPGWLFPSNYSSMTPAQKDAALRNAAQHDFAMILLDGNSQTGVMHYDLDWKGKWVAATRVGYAGDILNGQIVQQSHGIVFFADSIPMFPSESLPNLVAHWQPITDLTSGTSGGAWIVNFDFDRVGHQQLADRGDVVSEYRLSRRRIRRLPDRSGIQPAARQGAERLQIGPPLIVGWAKAVEALRIFSVVNSAEPTRR